MKEREPQELLQHLNELRWCIIRSASAWVMATLIACLYVRPIIRYITFSASDLVVLGLTEALVAQIKVGGTAGAVLAAPIILYQIWRFIAPGLTDNERRSLLPLLPLVVVMPLLGGAFALCILLPQVVNLMRAFGDGEWHLFLSLGQYISFALGLTWPIALAFEAPVLVYLGARLGWIKSSSLGRHWRLVVLMVFVAAAILSPGPDVVLQMILVAPLLLLYGLCVAVAYLADRQRKTSIGSAG